MDENITVFFEFRMERYRPEPLLDETGLHLAAERICYRQIEKRLWKNLTVLYNLNPTNEHHDEDPSEAIVVDDIADRFLEPVRYIEERRRYRAGDLPNGPRDLLGSSVNNMRQSR